MNTDFAFLDAMRRTGDVGADELVSSTFEKNEQKILYNLLGTNDATVSQTADHPVKHFLLQQKPTPQWFDEKRILNGQQFFKKYALDIMTLLGAKSLPYCYAASPGNKAIYLTEKMRSNPGKRLVETAHFIITVMQPGSFSDARLGIIQINKTRLIHALVRYHLRRKSWNNAWGLPVNQEDMAGTNLAFSYIILLGLQQAGFLMREEELEDFLFVWRYIGYQLNINEELLPSSVGEASLLELAIKQRHFKRSEEGIRLTEELLKHYKASFPLIPGYLVDAQIKYFVGDELSTLLGLQSSPFKDRFIKLINRLRIKVNKYYVDKSSYEKMIRNHYMLKEKYLGAV
ncbi:oxygenase MpaB family protein [Chryseosolibacter indicus]|uniref:DUF2236 domain-containing protein n=1 Tax=Chryseosolibacter indicus TaxID=2782351 RepID=A0ABS5VPP9_9BACT|nr:oxygenase MpaB family protein [Chryseosolibacter indicus]MBT1702998.1 DUF2236 domain-containing protein [Chryseosolibacter indicus]